MTEDDLPRFAVEFLSVAEVFYNRRDIAPEAVCTYFEALREHSLDRVIGALRTHVKTPIRCKFMPLPGDLEECISGTRSSAALTAWTSVERAIRCFGRYRSCVFDDAIIHVVIDDMGGWCRMCDVVSDKELAFQRQEFCRRYELAKPGTPYPATLFGLLDVGRLAQGLQPTSPCIVGHKDKAAQVLRLGCSDAVAEVAPGAELQST